MAEIVATDAGVDAQQVETALRDLWRREAASSGVAVTRLRTLNLVIAAGESAADDDVQQTLHWIATRHPSRVVVLATTREEQPDGIQTSVQIRSALGEAADRQVCSEEVTLTAGPSTASLLPGATLPLLVQDLPTYLWWWEPGDPMASPLFEALSHPCDRTIVDSGAVPAPGLAFLRRLAQRTAERREHAFADLNWNRLYPWRELTAQLFVSSDTRDSLDQITSVEVAYHGSDKSAGGPTQALLYIAWLAGRLDWRPTAARSRGNEREIWFDRAQGDVSARILAGESTPGQGNGLAGVQLIGGTEDQSTHLVLELAEDGSFIASTSDLPLSIERRRITRYTRPSTADVLLDELDSRHRDDVLVEALAVIAAMPDRIER